MPIPASPTSMSSAPRPETSSVRIDLQPLHLVGAADERAQRDGLGRRLKPDEPPEPDRLEAPLHLHLAERLELEAAEDALGRRLADNRVPGGGRGLQARGDVRRVPERDGARVGGSDDPDRDLTGVDPDARAEVGDSPGRLDLARVVTDEVENPDSSPGSPLGVVLVRGGDPEEGGDPVAHVRLHVAAELLDGVAHPGHALANHDLHLVGGEAFAE